MEIKFNEETSVNIERIPAVDGTMEISIRHRRYNKRTDTAYSVEIAIPAEPKAVAVFCAAILGQLDG